MTQLAPSARLALDTILQKPTRGIPILGPNIMEHEHIERLAGANPGDYVRSPVQTYLALQKSIGTNVILQWIPENPLSMGADGYEGSTHGATTGAQEIVRDGIVINSPEAVVEHMERIVFPSLVRATESFDEEACIQRVISDEVATQDLFGPEILKSPYGVIRFPFLGYCEYGYSDYFMAFALYPEVIEKHFSLQADFWARNNLAVAKAYARGNLPPLGFLDHDMADSRGTLVNVRALDELWFPHFARALEPLLKTDIKLVWHCDGNLMEMVPRLIEVGIRGFQGFQYEDGMDYERICGMQAKDGDDLIIVAGVSVTRTLPMGTPDDVKREMRWLVENGPRSGLFLAASSSVTPGVRWENIKTMVEGFRHYQVQGRY